MGRAHTGGWTIGMRMTPAYGGFSMELINTPRLCLAACAPETVNLLLRDRDGFSRALHVSLPDDWPEDDLREALPLFGDFPETWGLWLMFRPGDRILAGSLGFTGPPDASGTVEIGYGVLPAFRGKGYAREAVRAIIAWAGNCAGVSRIIAHCEPDNTPSVRVLMGAGMHLSGGCDGLLEWELVPGRSRRDAR